MGCLQDRLGIVTSEEISLELEFTNPQKADAGSAFCSFRRGETFVLSSEHLGLDKGLAELIKIIRLIVANALQSNYF